MANRRQYQNQFQNRRNDFNRNDRQGFSRPGVSPWQGGSPGSGLGDMPLLGGGSTEATLALANNLITNLLQTRQNSVPSLLDMPIRRDFGPVPDRFDRSPGYGHGPGPRMGNQGNFRRTSNFNPRDRMNVNRKPFRPNDGYRPPAQRPKKDADSRAKPVKESDAIKTESDIKTEPGKDGKKASRYDDIHQSLLKCHICNTSMWDGRSFENHINGMAHSIMMQKTAEGYALTADTMRQEFKIREMKRSRKSREPQSRDFYCAMCDMCAADGTAHRTTPGHRKLKKYLHPSCTTCRKEMPTRLELDEHRLSHEHLRRLPVEPDHKAEALVVSTLAAELAGVREERKPSAAQVKAEPADGEAAEPQTEKEEPAADGTIVDFKEDEELGTVTAEMVPAYNPRRGVGASFVAPFSCFRCGLCRRLLQCAAAAEAHLRTTKHHQAYAARLRAKAGLLPESRKRPVAAAAGDAKRRRRDGDAAQGAEPEAGHETNGTEQDQPADQETEDIQGNEGNLEGADDGNEETLEDGADGNGDGADDGNEDWEKLDEVLADEGVLEPDNDSAQPPPEAEPEQTPEEAEAPEPEPEAETPEVKEPETPKKQFTPNRNSYRGTPRGRGRGRRQRGRF